MQLSEILENMVYGSGGAMSLSEAMVIAKRIADLHGSDVHAAHRNGYDMGFDAGKDAAQDSMRREISTEDAKLRDVYVNTLRIARETVPGIVEEFGRDYKIRCIKEIRNRSGLGLKDAKDIVDEYLHKLDEAERVEQEAQEGFMETALDHSNYSDEPPF